MGEKGRERIEEREVKRYGFGGGERRRKEEDHRVRRVERKGVTIKIR